MKKASKTKWIKVLIICIMIVSVFSVAVGIYYNYISNKEKVCSNPLFWFNSVILPLALSFISAFIVWFLTVEVKNHIRRNTQLWWIHDQLLSLNDSIHESETLFDRFDKITREQIFEMFIESNQKDQNRITLEERIKLIDKETLRILDLNLSWNDEEYDLMAQIHNVCHEIADILKYNVQPNKVDDLFGLIKMLMKKSRIIDCKASQIVQ